MIFTVIGWIVFFALTIISISAFSLYLKARSLSNGIMAVSSKEFHESADSLMSTPDELPKSVLDFLDVMINSATSVHSSTILVRTLKKGPNSPAVQARIERKRAFQNDFDKMRPELQSLFLKTTVSWLNYISHQNVVSHIRASMIMMRYRSQGFEASKAEAEAGLSLLGRLGGTRAVC